MFIGLADDLDEEAAALQAAVGDGRVVDLHRSTPFARWRGVDVFAHLTLLDRMATLALDDDRRYDAELAAFVGATAGASLDVVYERMNAFELTRVDITDPVALLTEWRRGNDELCRVLDRASPGKPIGWFGRAMSAERLASARQMEIFAYGQDVVDGLGLDRPATDRLRPVADFAVRTFKFSFVNRSLEVPGLPLVRLTAPSGATWTWGDQSSIERVEGPAEDLCLVATQRRNVADTHLQIVGAGARQWMQIAQTIAGAPRHGPPPGERVRR
jgi:uncharacterized protein (TIGR03084 family)